MSLISLTHRREVGNGAPVRMAATEVAGEFVQSVSISNSTPISVIDASAGSAQNAAAVTPGAGALAATTRALFIGGTGNVTVTMAGGGSVQFTNVPDGTTIPIAVTHVTAATASDIVALW